MMSNEDPELKEKIKLIGIGKDLEEKDKLATSRPNEPSSTDKLELRVR